MLARVLVAGVALAACADHPRDVAPTVETSRSVYFDLPLWFGAKLDVLFVIDSSPAMAAHAENLRANYEEMMTVLATLDGPPSLQIAVVTADLGTTGAQDDLAGPALGARCRGRGDDARFRQVDAIASDVLVSRPLADGSRIDNHDGTLPEAFTALADVGADGCELVQPLEAMRRALARDAGFVRDDAFLHVVFLTAQDDCSFPSTAFLDDLRTAPMDTYRCYARGDALVAVDDYVAFLNGLKRDPSRVVVSVAAGPPGPIVTVDEGRHRFVAPACSFADATAAPAPRLHRFASAFVNRRATTSLCQPDLTGVMAVHAGLLRLRVGNPCLPVPLLDVDPAMPGDQPDCAIDYAFRRELVGGQVIPSCAAATTPPCWHIDPDPLACPDGTTQRVFVEHGPVELPSETHVIGQCLVE